MKTNLSDFVVTFDNVLTKQQCQQYIDMFEKHKSLQTLNGREQYEHLPNSQWDEFNINQFFDRNDVQSFFRLFEDCRAKYHQLTDMAPLPKPKGLAPLIMKKYLHTRDDGFEPHYDSVGPVANRYLVFLLYLNDVEEGGETSFVDLGIDVKPKAGTLLMFPPYWMYMHQAMQPVSNDKYILSSYYLW